MRRLMLLTSAAAAVAALQNFPGRQAPARLHATVALTIGANESASDEYLFGDVRAQAIAPDGRLVVADNGFEAVRVYDRRGRFLYDLFRKGAGPGEIRRIGGLGFSQDGLLWVRDEGNSRFSAFRLGEKSASYVRTIRRATVSMGEREPVTFDAFGLPIDVSSRLSFDGVLPRVRLRLDSLGRVIGRDTIREPPPDSLDAATTTRTDRDGNVTRTTIEPIFGSRLLVAFAPAGDYARAVGRKYDVEWRGQDGRLIRHIRRAVPPVPYNAAELDAFNAAVSGAGRRAPRAKAAIEEILFDQENRLWVVRNVPAGTLREADVYDRTGRHVAIMVLPKHVQFGQSTAIRNNSALVRVVDTSGVRVELLHFR